MRTFILLLLALLITAATGWSQTTGTAGQTPQGDVATGRRQTIQVAVPSKIAIDDPTFFGKSQATYQIVAEIVVWGVGSVVHMQVVTESIRIISGCSDADSTSTVEMFDVLAQTAVAQQLALGIILCPGSCVNPSYAVVHTAACVQRFGSGCATTFQNCDISRQALREYSVCCPTGPADPSITLVQIITPGCYGTGSLCQSTTP